MEHALLPSTVRGLPPVRVFSVYNLVAFGSAAAGAATAGVVVAATMRSGFAEVEAQRHMMLAYAGAGALLTALYVALTKLLGETGAVQAPHAPAPGGLHRSRGVVRTLAALQGLDSFAGGFILQSFLAYWFHLRYGASGEALGWLFFGTNVLSALSFLAAVPVAERVGLLNTMVFTHLPSNLLLLAVPFMPSFEAAAGLLLARHLLSQMDVPTRQAYTVALVAPDERAAAAGLTVGVRALTQAVAPLVTGLAVAATASPAPFLLAGGLKIVYDLALFFRFRRVPLPDGAR
jgi:hypothetical protein